MFKLSNLNVALVARLSVKSINLFEELSVHIGSLTSLELGAKQLTLELATPYMLQSIVN